MLMSGKDETLGHMQQELARLQQEGSSDPKKLKPNLDTAFAVMRGGHRMLERQGKLRSVPSPRTPLWQQLAEAA